MIQHIYDFELSKLGSKLDLSETCDFFIYDKIYYLKVDKVVTDDGIQRGYSNNPKRVLNEYFATKCYNIFGLKTVDFVILYNKNDNPFPLLMLVSKYLPQLEKVKCDCFCIDAYFYGFFFDCIMLNWDIYNDNNILKIGKGDQLEDIVRVDCGGALFYLARSKWIPSSVSGELKNISKQPIEHESFIKNNNVFKFLKQDHLVKAGSLLKMRPVKDIINDLEILQSTLESNLKSLNQKHKHLAQFIPILTKLVYDRYRYYYESVDKILENFVNTAYKKFIIQKYPIPEHFLYLINIWNTNSDSVMPYNIGVLNDSFEYQVPNTYDLKNFFVGTKVPTNLIRHVKFICDHNCDKFFKSFCELNAETHKKIVNQFQYLPNGQKDRSQRNIIKNFMIKFQELSTFFYIELGTILYRGIKVDESISTEEIVSRFHGQFNATSLVREKAEKFSNDGGRNRVKSIFMTFYINAHVDCIPVFVGSSAISDEYEIVLPPQLKYTLIKTGKQDNLQFMDFSVTQHR